MAEGAHVSSIQAIEHFRASLLVYLSKARPLIEDSVDEIVRLRDWIRSDRRLYWEHQVKRRTRALEDARQALFSAEMAKLRAPTHAELQQLQQAKRSLNEAEDKVRLLKKAASEFEHQVEPLLKGLEELRTVLANGAPKAALHLGEIIGKLQAYAEVSARPAAPPQIHTPPPPHESPQ